MKKKKTRDKDEKIKVYLAGKMYKRRQDMTKIC